MWMTMDEIAEYLRVSKETIYKMAQKGMIPGSKLGNQWRFKKEKVDRWLESQSNNSDSSLPSTNETKSEVISQFDQRTSATKGA